MKQLIMRILNIAMRLIAVATIAGIVWYGFNFITNTNILLANVNGASMNYTLLDKEQVIIKPQEQYERGDIIAFYGNLEDPLNKSLQDASGNIQETRYVKRVVAVGGDTVEGKKDGLYINGEKANEPYLANEQTTFPIEWNIQNLAKGEYWADDKNATVVPEGEYFVLGDNREVSDDSRYFGFINPSSILGKVYQLKWNQNKTLED